MTTATGRQWRRGLPAGIGVGVAAALLLGASATVHAQRLLGIDISAWQGSISVTNWNTLHNTNNRDFVFIRSSRGGTTGFDRQDGLLTSAANCNGVSTTACLSRRYDDPYFGQNITRATNAGLFAGPYHRSRADIIASSPNSGGIANSGTDEATHMIQMAGAWMRPGYLPPVLDFEDGISERTDIEMAQFALDFSNRIYEVMQIRPAIYINGNYAQNSLAGGTSAQRAQLAQQSSTPPSVISPAFPTLWSARWPNQSDPNSIDVQNLHPTVGFSNIYGPWDDYGVTHPWSFWQYASTARLSGYNNGNSNIDVNVSQGDIEFVKDQLVPAIWWHNSSGDWSTLSNWNSGQPLNAYNTSLSFDQQPLPAPYIPPVFPNMSPRQGTTTLPVPRLPGAAGSGPTSGQNDTVILERPNANITVTLSTGAHNIRKLYMREALNITGGSLTINYDPNYVSDTVNYPNALRSGPISAQFSGPVTLNGGALNVHTLQVDATRTFTLTTGTLTFNRINLMPHSSTPARLDITGDVNINPLGNATATVANGAGSGSTGRVELGGGTPTIISVGNGPAPVDLSIDVPVTNGGFSKIGQGTMRLTASNTYGGGTSVNAGTLLVDNTSGSGTGAGAVTVGGGVLGGTGTISGAVTVHIGAHLAPGVGPGTLTVGGVALDSGAHYDVELAGLTPGTQHDRLVVNGAATLGGTLNVSLLGGFTPAIGNSFNILSANSINGTFESLAAPAIQNAMWSVNYGSDSVLLSLSLAGDYNGDGVVDGADYLVWRRDDGSTAGYDLWRAHYGLSAESASGVGAASAGVGAVPEPAAITLLLLGVLALQPTRRR